MCGDKSWAYRKPLSPRAGTVWWLECVYCGFRLPDLTAANPICECGRRFHLMTAPQAA